MIFQLIMTRGYDREDITHAAHSSLSIVKIILLPKKDNNLFKLKQEKM